jgi:hypothetical protein
MAHATLVKQYPSLKGFSVHGVRFDNVSTATRAEDDDQAIGSCPVCGHESDHGNLYVNVKNRQWTCHRCGKAGGFGKFLETVAAENVSLIKGKPMLSLVKSRGIKAATMRRWGVGYSAPLGHYTIPVRGPHTLMDLRIYKLGKKTMTTAGASVWLVGYEKLAAHPDWPVYLCEGEWDAMALDEIFTMCKIKAVVLGVTGAGIFKKDWVIDFQGRDVVLVYDHDDSGIRGEGKAWTMLQGVARSLRAMQWPEDLPKGFDVRDLYLHAGDEQSALKALTDGLRAEPRMQGAAEGGTQASGRQANDSPLNLTPGEGLSREQIIKGYRKWMHLPNPELLDIIYGTLLGNRLPGDPLWLFLVAPPGGAKSEFLMSLGKAPKVMTTTSLTPHALVSGAVSPGGGDPSLIPKLDGKVLVIKDFTSILSMNATARDEILGVLRDAYDGETTKIFGTGLIKSYQSLFGIIAGVTPAYQMFSAIHASLGERFICYRIRIPGRIDIGGDIIARAIDNIAKEGKMRGDLQGVANEALNIEVNLDKLPKIRAPMRKKLVGLAQWVAATRAVVVRERYTREMMFKPVAEIGTRLAKQLAKLALGIGLYHQATELTDEHYSILVKVARDTVPDRVEDILRQMWLNEGVNDYMATARVQELTRLNPETCRTLLQDLTSLHVLQSEQSSGMGQKYRIAPSMARVMRPLGIYKEEEAWRKKVKG